MLIGQKEIERFKSLILDVKSGQLPEELAGSALWAFFVENPHLLMAGKFDEHMQQPILDDDSEMVMNRGMALEVAENQLLADPKISFVDFKLPRLEFRIPSGRWASLITVPFLENSTHFLFSFTIRQALREMSEAASSELISGEDEDFLHGDFLEHLDDLIFQDVVPLALEDLVAELESRVSRPRDRTSVLWTPKLWTPQEQLRQRSLVDTTLAPHFENWKRLGVSFDDLNPSEFEDLVAEVLFKAGLKIHKVREVPQGGRDLIARGSLIPDEEPIEMAVEVKHRAKVDRPEVQLALYQNRVYPALLFVTSGRFSAGVFQEKAREENRFRLFLKDGFAVGDLVREHFRLPNRIPLGSLGI